MKFVAKSLAALVALLALFVLAIQLIYGGKVLPGVQSGGLNLAGRTEAEASQLLAEQMRWPELRFTHHGRNFAIPADQIGLVPDPAATAKAAVAAGHGRGLATLTAPLRALFGTVEVPRRFQLNQVVLGDRLTEQTAGVAGGSRNARITRSGTDFAISREATGTIVDIPANLTATRLALQRGETTLPLFVRPSQPAIEAKSLQPTRALAETVATRPVTVTAGSRTFRPAAGTVASWLTFVRHDESLPGAGSYDPRVAFDQLLGVGVTDRGILPGNHSTLRLEINRETVGGYVAEVAAAVDQPPVNARVGFANGSLQITGAPQDGTVIDRSVAVEVLASNVLAGKPANLPIGAKPADIRAETLPQLGVTTLIGTATTTFGGSPVNRTYNIGVGAARFDGVLIKPGEEFSFNEVLGDVGPETGYRPELVIKENKTVPEYGGGLCQVSTTMFRAALASGLPITARTNHSYAVHYYAPIGMDATIYPPNPDMKFRNNTGGHILVQTRKVGQSLTYDFFGTTDGRTARTEIMHIAASESAGGTASFRYVVEGGPEPINRVFSSSYRPQKDFPIGQSLN